MNLGSDSLLVNSYLEADLCAELRELCDGAPYQYYQKRGHDYKSAPKVEYFTVDDKGRRPVYAWSQHTELHHAGYAMPPILLTIKGRIETQFGLVPGYLNHCILIVNECGDHGVPPHSDKHKDGQFFDISLGDTMTMVLRNKCDATVYKELKLTNNSLLAIGKQDNQLLTHEIAKDPNVQCRYSVVFRRILDTGAKNAERFMPVDPAAAARVQPGGDLFVLYERPAVNPMHNSPRSGDTSGLHTGGSFGMLSQDNIFHILGHIPSEERLFAAMTSTGLYHVMKVVVAKSPDIRSLGLNMSGKLFFTPKRLMFQTPERIQLLDNMAKAAFNYTLTHQGLSGVFRVDKTLLEWYGRNCKAMEMLVQYCPVQTYSYPFSVGPWLKSTVDKYGIKTTIFDTKKIMTAAVSGGNCYVVDTLLYMGFAIDVYACGTAIALIRRDDDATQMIHVILDRLCDDCAVPTHKMERRLQRRF
jgi:hypothetical protein